MKIRRATVDDAASIAEVHVRSWQIAYRDHMPEAFLAGLNSQKRAELWRQAATAPEQRLFVSEQQGGTITGFCSFMPSRDRDASAATGEIVALYVHPDHWRSGHGRALLSAALDQAKVLGYREATLWVLEGNQRARAFYEAAGFVPDGGRKDDDRWADFVLREVRYRLAV